MTQKETLLEVYLGVDNYLGTLLPGTGGKEKAAIETVANLIQKRIKTLNKQIDEYQGKLKRNAK